MKLSFPSLVAGTLLMTEPDQIYSSLAAGFLEFPENTFWICVVGRSVEYLQLSVGFHEVGPEECSRRVYCNHQKGVLHAR